MKSAYWAVLSAALSLTQADTVLAQKDKPVNTWLTAPSRSIFFQPQPAVYFSREDASSQDPVIAVDEKKKFQQIDGFGWALTGGSAQAFMRMSPGARTALVPPRFFPGNEHIGGSQVPVGH